MVKTGKNPPKNGVSPDKTGANGLQNVCNH
jgi:hypothetical protein